MQLINHPNVNDPSSREGKEFRMKFRTPFPVFLEIIKLCKMMGKTYNYAEYNHFGTRSIPLEIKVLSVLRTLGCGMKFNEASELSGYMSMSTLNAFFKTFCQDFTDHFKEEYIGPLKGEALIKSMEAYGKLGLPGCIGSMDATFLDWDRVPHEDQNLCNGDKGKGLLYQCIVTHFVTVRTCL
jgi:hypothetical protein